MVDFDHFRIVLYRASGEVALDTVVAFPADADSINLNLRVTVLTGGTETFTAHLAMISGADTVFRGGPLQVTATVGLTGTTVSAPLRYTGIGANAAAVVIAAADTSLFFSDSLTLTATALDSAGKPIPGTPIEWETLDSARARVPSAAAGKVVALSQRGVARIVAETPTGIADTASVTVQPVASTLTLLSGSGQTATVRSQLAQPLVVKVGASDGLPVRGVAVRFAVVAGNGTLTDTLVATDTAGLARTAWTVGTVAGTDSVQATVVGRPIAGVTFTSSVVAGLAKALAFTAEPPAGTAYQAPFGVVVTAKDSLANTATAFTGPVTLALGANPAGGTLSGTLTQNAVAGVATFTGLSLDNIGAGYTLSASAGGPAAATSTAFGIVAPAGWNAWINTAGGNWSLASNWSSGAVPVASDSVAIKQSGTYTVTLDMSAATPRLDVGAPHGAQTLSVPTAALTVVRGVFGSNTTLDLSGPGTFTAAGTVTVAGPVNFSGGTLADSGQLTVTGPIAWSGGSISVTGTGSVLRFFGGSGASFGGTATVGSGAMLDLAGGIYTLSSNLSVPGGGTLALSGGGLILNGHAGLLAGNLVTSGTGAIRMAAAADSLDIGGNATFGGGLGGMNAGVIRLGGNFTQTGTANFQGQAQSAAVAHRVVLAGAANHTVSFADPTTSYFRRLVIEQGAGSTVTLLTDARTTFYSNQSSTTTLQGLKGPTIPRLFVDTLSGMPGSAVATPLVILLSGLIPDSGSVTADTMVFTGAGQIISTRTAGTFPGSIAYHSIRVAQSSGMAAFDIRFPPVPNDLVVSSGTLGTGGYPITVLGNFRTEGSGSLAMGGADSLDVGGDVTFGGSSIAALDSGAITVRGNFIQQGPGATFAPRATRVWMARATPGVQTIQFQDPINSRFHDLVLARPTRDTVRLLSDVAVTDSAIVADSSVLASTALEVLKLPRSGVVYMRAPAPVLRPSRVEFGVLQLDTSVAVGATPAVSPDMAVFLASGLIRSAPAYAWKSVRLAAGPGDTLTTIGTKYDGNLIISGGTYYTAPNPLTYYPLALDSIKGFLRTEGTGIFAMAGLDGDQTVVVRDSAVFAGGDETGQLEGGLLFIGGNFVQRGGPTTFAATEGSSHKTIFEGSGTQTVYFASPGNNQSRFNHLWITRNNNSTSGELPSGITLLSDIYVAGNLNDSSETATDSIVGNGHTVYTGGLNLWSPFGPTMFVMDNAQLVTTVSGMASFDVSGLTFRNMSPTVTQWTLRDLDLLGTVQTMSALNFASPPTTGLYISATSLDTLNTFLLLVYSSSPATLDPSTYSLTNVSLEWNAQMPGAPIRRAPRPLTRRP